MQSRRSLIQRTLFGASGIGLRALATGLPAAFIASPGRALAQMSAVAGPQFLLWAHSGNGDPSSSNTPGTYEDAYQGPLKVAHSQAPAMAATSLKLGAATYQAAKPWSTLPQSALDRCCFFHHSTRTNNHTDDQKVLKLMGAVNRQEMLMSAIAKQLAPALGTIATEPLPLSNQHVSFSGRSLAQLRPTGLRDALISPVSPLRDLQKLRDNDLDRLNALCKEHGNVEERRFLDEFASTQAQARGISIDLLNLLSAIKDDSVDGQIVAASVLFKMKVTPVVSFTLDFGSDNHDDPALARETARHQTALASINRLLAQLQSLGLQDSVTFVMMNVFGRTLVHKGKGMESAGRDHLANHHCTVMIGKHIKASVIGGIEAKGNDFSATAIDPSTGGAVLAAAAGTNFIPVADSLAAAGKTIAAAVGLPEAAILETVATGKVVRAALVGPSGEP